MLVVVEEERQSDATHNTDRSNKGSRRQQEDNRVKRSSSRDLNANLRNCWETLGACAAGSRRSRTRVSRSDP